MVLPLADSFGGELNRRTDAGWSSLVARRAHNPKVAGSNPAPATPERPANAGLSVTHITGGLFPRYRRGTSGRRRRQGIRPLEVSEPRGHHLLAKLYQRGFASEKAQVRLVAKALGRQFVCSIEDAFKRRDWNAFIDEDGERRQDFEKLLAEDRSTNTHSDRSAPA
jgi:hypothetical protein